MKDEVHLVSIGGTKQTKRQNLGDKSEVDPNNCLTYFGMFGFLLLNNCTLLFTRDLR